MAEKQNIQWFPGHMTKGIRRIKESLRMVDLVAEIVDARLPQSSRNPDIDRLVKNKPRIVLLNKCDMANPNVTAMWVNYFNSKKIKAIPVDCKSGKGVKLFLPAAREIMKPSIEKWQQSGMTGRSIRIMIVGIPNVGKSSFINKLAGKTRAKAEDRPGVTRGNQWYTIDGNIELLDTPGVLWPKFDDPEVGEKLAFTGAVKDQILDIELLAVRLLEVFKECPNQFFIERFKLQNVSLDDYTPYEMLELVGRKRGMLISGGEVDVGRAANVLLDEYRGGKLGKVSLELPPRG